MAEVTLGIGTSHSPMLSTPHEALAGLADLDRARLPEFAARARESAGWIERELRPEVTLARHEATQAAITQLGEVLADEAPDAVIVIGDDQGEWFSSDRQPALCIYWGDTVERTFRRRSRTCRPSAGSPIGDSTATAGTAPFPWLPTSAGI